MWIGVEHVTPPRRGRGRPPKISQERIVEAAIELGLDSFSMQGIAEHLGVTAPALYSHVAGREQVLDLVDTPSTTGWPRPPIRRAAGRTG